MTSERHGSGALHEGVLFFTKPGIGGFVDSWPETLVPSASNRSTPEWTLVDSQERVDKKQLRASRRGRLRLRFPPSCEDRRAPLPRPGSTPACVRRSNAGGAGGGSPVR